MNLISEHNKKYEFFHEITGIAMKVHRKYKPGLLESAYEAALKYLLELEGYDVERQVYLTHIPYGMLINFGSSSLYSEWYHRNDFLNGIEKIKLL